VCIPPTGNTCILGPTRVHNTNGISIGSAVLHSSRQSVATLYNGPTLPLQKLPTPMGLPANTRFIWPTLASDETRSSAGREFQTTAMETPKSLDSRTILVVRRTMQHISGAVYWPRMKPARSRRTDTLAPTRSSICTRCAQNTSRGWPKTTALLTVHFFIMPEL